MANASLAKAAERFSILQPQEVILGLFGEYVKDHEHVWSGGLVKLLCDLGFSVAASRIAINRVCVREMLESRRDGRYIFYLMTPKLQVVVDEGRHKTFSPVGAPDWDGKWTFVLYSDSNPRRPEAARSDRARLGRWLNLRDFGVLQEGIWIAPGAAKDNLAALIESLDLSESVLTFTATLTDAEQIQSIVCQAWNLPLLGRLYDVFLAKFTPMLDSALAQKLSAKQCFVVRTRLIEMFRKMTVLDPNLPDEILRVDWKRKEAIALFQTLHPLLQANATKYFSDNTRRPQ